MSKDEMIEHYYDDWKKYCLGFDDTQYGAYQAGWLASEQRTREEYDDRKCVNCKYSERHPTWESEISCANAANTFNYVTKDFYCKHWQLVDKGE